MMRVVGTRLIFVGFLAALLLGTAGAAPAASDGSNYFLRLSHCLAFGSATVPVGSDLRLGLAYLGPQGTLEQVREALNLSVTLDGTPVSDAFSYFSKVTDAPIPQSGPLPSTRFLAFGLNIEWEYDSGITLQNPGDTLVVVWDAELNRRIRDTGPPANGGGFEGPGGAPATCTITAT
jgi:hypothetical protein